MRKTVAVQRSLFPGLQPDRLLRFGDAMTLTEDVLETINPERLGVLNPGPTRKKVLTCVVRGMANQQIADYLGNSVSAVESHISAMYAKAHVRNRAGFVSWLYAPMSVQVDPDPRRQGFTQGLLIEEAS